MPFCGTRGWLYGSVLFFLAKATELRARARFLVFNLAALGRGGGSPPTTEQAGPIAMARLKVDCANLCTRTFSTGGGSHPWRLGRNRLRAGHPSRVGAFLCDVPSC